MWESGLPESSVWVQTVQPQSQTQVASADKGFDVEAGRATWLQAV